MNNIIIVCFPEMAEDIKIANRRQQISTLIIYPVPGAEEAYSF